MIEEKDEAAGRPDAGGERRGWRGGRCRRGRTARRGHCALRRGPACRDRGRACRDQGPAAARAGRDRECAPPPAARARRCAEIRAQALSRRICCRRSTICAGRSRRCPKPRLSDPRAKSLRDGVAATERELLAAFERHGLKRVDPKGERSTTISTRRSSRRSAPTCRPARSSRSCSRVTCCTTGCCARRWSASRRAVPEPDRLGSQRPEP